MGFIYCILPSLKLTVRTWKGTISIGNTSSNHQFSGATLVSGRVFIYLHWSHKKRQKTFIIGKQCMVNMSVSWILCVVEMFPIWKKSAKNHPRITFFIAWRSKQMKRVPIMVLIPDPSGKKKTAILRMHVKRLFFLSETVNGAGVSTYMYFLNYPNVGIYTRSICMY